MENLLDQNPFTAMDAKGAKENQKQNHSATN